MTGSDDRKPPEGSPRPEESRWSGVRRAEQVPVTDAMITPRSDSGEPRAVTGARPGEPRFCPQCGQQWTPDTSICQWCGHRIAPPEPSARTARRRTGRPAPDRGAQMGRFMSGPGSVRRMALILAVVAGLVLGLRTLTSRDSSTEGPEPTVETTAVQSDVAALEFYAGEISLLALDVAEAMDTGRQINDSWDSGSLEYDAAVAQMNALVSQVSVLPARLARATPPQGISTRLHQGLAGSLATFISAAETMQEGLESTDTGETRRAGLLAFETAAFEFGLLAGQVATAVEEMQPPPEAAESGAAG
ncbi:MAG: zinc ribbon domain-containing protein [Acidimicrobiia bacterium]|nr:zinc ribbon domain-containing protein [Acidimicrobiia bacterium]